MIRTYLSWTAIFSGAIVGVGLNFLLNLMMLALAIACFSVTSNGNTTFSLPGFLCFGLSALIAMFTTGWVAGKLTPHVLEKRVWGILIGFLAWSMLLIITVILITNFIQYAAFHSNFTSNLVAVKLTNNAPMLTETKATGTTSPLNINIELGKKIITLNAFLTWILFTLGGSASCLGGYLGYQVRPRLVQERDD